MESLFLILLSIGAFLCFFYLLLIASYCYAWVKTKEFIFPPDSSVFISVIIAARNEEKNIGSCLDAILAQNYPTDKFEIIVVDDHSDDATPQIIRKYSEKHPQIKYFQLPENNLGKKHAVGKAIENANGELIVTTDADCEMGVNWLSVLASFYKKKNAKMIVAPVAFYKENTWFEKFQSLEFMALIACGGASLFYNKAIMCNGANLAYPKSVYRAVGGFDGIDSKSSGDDVLLMYKINKMYPGTIHFLKNREAIVYTKPKETVKEFIQQRKRWASKGFYALNDETKRVSLLIYLFNAFILFVPIIGGICLGNSTFYLPFMEFCLILIGIKCFIDFLLLFLSASFFGKKKFLLFFFPEQIIYMIYVALLGLMGSIGKYEWKGRKTN